MTVIRRLHSLGEGKLTEISTDQLNILILTARPSLDPDIEYLLVTQQIMDIVSQLDSNHLPVYVEIVRPGTWAALTTCLEKRRKEGLLFHIIHMDVHGLVVTDGKHKGSYLTFLNQKGSGPHHKKATDVAMVLINYGIRVVIMNACRSSISASNPELSAMSGVALTLIESGISVALGMSYNISQGGAEKFVRAF
jgi:hypothetical protein